LSAKIDAMQSAAQPTGSVFGTGRCPTPIPRASCSHHHGRND
jgi:hypothetical protein